MSFFPGPPAKSPYLLEFKAGRMKRDGKLVSPDVRKGLVAVYQADDSLMHFTWKDRKNNKNDDDSDLIIFPEEAEFMKVKQTPQRVYMLVFKGSNKKFFFWMQESQEREDKDQELVKKVNWLLNNPPAPGADDPFAGLDLEFADGVMEQDTDDSADTGKATTASSVPGTQPSEADVAMLQALLRGIKMPDNVDLQQVLSSDVLAPLLDSEEALDRLKPFLPPPHTPDAMRSVIKSPQFAQAVQAFNAALKSGDMNLQALGIESDRGAAGVEAFLKALQTDADKKKTEDTQDNMEE